MKNVFNHTVIEVCGRHIQKYYPEFCLQDFIQLAGDDLENRELKQRAEQICFALKAYLPSDFIVAIDILLKTLTPVHDNIDLSEVSCDEGGVAGWMILPYSQYVGELGQAHLSASLEALKQMTKRFSSEFGIRYFLLSQPEQTLQIIEGWTQHPCHHVRRLVSEGTRPLLPWAMQLPQFKQDPRPVLPLLEQLRSDESEYVRRSVANHLNDIAKSQPDLVAEIAQNWLINADKPRFRLVKHACRTLLKQGHPQTLQVFGYGTPDKLETSLQLDRNQLLLGDAIELTVLLENNANKKQNLLIDYLVYHQKANGAQTAKVFKWKQIELAAGQKVSLTKRHAIKPISTRKYYPGTHKIALQINGQEIVSQQFELLI